MLDQARARRKFCLWYNTRLSNALLFENDWTGTLVVHRKDEPLAKGGLNGGHRPPLPCDLPMGGFPYEFGPETGR